MSTTVWKEHFGNGRKWRVLTEATGTVTADPVRGVKVVYRRGHFKIEGPGVFQSPLSFNKGKGGVLLQEVRGGADVPGSCVPVGEKILPRVKAEGAFVA